MGGARGARAGSADRPRPPRRRLRASARRATSRRCCASSALIALAILVVVLLVVWVEGCTARTRSGSATRRTSPRSARSATRPRGSGSSSSTTLTTPGLKQEDLDAKLGGYVQTAENQVQRARTSNRPGPMVGPNDGRRRGAAVPGERAARAADGVQETADETDASIGRRAAPRADAAPARERHHLDGLVPGAGRRPSSRTRGSRGSTVPSSEFVTADELVSRARSPRSGSGSRARRPAARRPACTATGSRP